MKYSGQLSYHVEMCCGAWPQFHDDRGLHGDENQYWDWAWTINFSKETKLKNIVIFNEKGDEVYNGPWTMSRIKSATAPNCFACPEEMEVSTWIEFCRNRYRATIETDEKLDGYEKWLSSKVDDILLEKK